MIPPENVEWHGFLIFDLIIPIDSLTVIPLSCSEKKNYEEFDKNVCALNKLD